MSDDGVCVCCCAVLDVVLVAEDDTLADESTRCGVLDVDDSTIIIEMPLVILGV